MQGFPGFPDGKLTSTAIPDLFFSDLLPLIDDLFELKVTLHCLWVIQHKKEGMRYTTRRELAQDDTLTRSLDSAEFGAGEALREGLERAVARGTLLQVTVQHAQGKEETLYLPNSESGRHTIDLIGRGEWQPEDMPEKVHLYAHRPNIFALYEQNIGMLQPLLVEELMDAERAYPPEWIEEAFRIAVANNVRRWAYIRRILERWASEGRGRGRSDESKKERRRYIEGEYSDFIEH